MHRRADFSAGTYPGSFPARVLRVNTPSGLGFVASNIGAFTEIPALERRVKSPYLGAHDRGYRRTVPITLTPAFRCALCGENDTLPALIGVL